MTKKTRQAIDQKELIAEKEAILEERAEEHFKWELYWARAGIEVEDVWEEAITFRAGGEAGRLLTQEKGQEMRQRAHKALDEWMNQFMH